MGHGAVDGGQGVTEFFKNVDLGLYFPRFLNYNNTLIYNDINEIQKWLDDFLLVWHLKENNRCFELAIYNNYWKENWSTIAANG